MFAIIRTGGKQYRVAEGDRIEVERNGSEAGATIDLDEVLMIGGDNPVVGAPTISGAKVTATVEALSRGPKLIVFKKRRRKNSRRKNGHRQDLMVLKITGIQAA